MNQTLTRQAIAEETLLLIFNAEPLKCESETHGGGDTTCSYDVAYLLIKVCRSEPFKICTNMGKLAKEYIAAEAYRCIECEDLLEDCWSVRPI